MPEPQRFDGKIPTFTYKCPYEGRNCLGNKHCHILETTDELKSKLTVVIQCPVRHREKISVEIGA